MKIGDVAAAMCAYNAGDARRVNHLMKVFAFAKTIGEREGLDAQTQEILEVAALTHDIGIRNCERKYGNCTGAHQQEEGPPEARAMLVRLGAEEHIIERVCWLIAHHHTYTNIQGMDYQILIEGTSSSTHMRTKWTRTRSAPCKRSSFAPKPAKNCSKNCIFAQRMHSHALIFSRNMV